MGLCATNAAFHGLKVGSTALQVNCLMPGASTGDLVLRGAAAHSPELARIRDDIAERRAQNLRLLAQDLLSTADVIWSMDSAEFHHLLVHERGWSSVRFEHWLADTWSRLFLAAVPPAPPEQRPVTPSTA